jgi:hypothetical protein
MPLENPQQRPTGRILKRIGDRYLVFYEGRDIVCAVRQKVAKGDRYPAIGDWVEFSEIGDRFQLDTVGCGTQAASAGNACKSGFAGGCVIVGGAGS